MLRLQIVQKNSQTSSRWLLTAVCSLKRSSSSQWERSETRARPVVCCLPLQTHNSDVSYVLKCLWSNSVFLCQIFSQHDIQPSHRWYSVPVKGHLIHFSSFVSAVVFLLFPVSTSQFRCSEGSWSLYGLLTGLFLLDWTKNWFILWYCVRLFHSLLSHSVYCCQVFIMMWSKYWCSCCSSVLQFSESDDPPAGRGRQPVLHLSLERPGELHHPLSFCISFLWFLCLKISDGSSVDIHSCLSMCCSSSFHHICTLDQAATFMSMWDLLSCCCVSSC